QAGYIGPDAFAYIATDGLFTSAANVAIGVNVGNLPPSFVKGPDQTVFEDAPARSIAGWATSISPGAPGEAGQTVDFQVSVDNPALFSAQPAVSATGTLTFTPAPDANGVATISVRAHEDGGTLGAGVDTSPAQTFTIAILPVNDAPRFSKGVDPQVAEDAGPPSIVQWATRISVGPADEAWQTVSFAVSTTNPALFTAAGAPAVDPSGTLTFTPAPNANGSAIVTVTLRDSGGTADGGVDVTAPVSFTITVGAVNDAPSFTKGANVTVLEDASAQSIAWATAISPGPADEAAQALDFIVSNTSNALFSVQPAVSPAGTLSFTLASNAHGVATVTVKLHDNGGTFGGGADTSAPQTFTITVTAVNDAPTFKPGPDQTVKEDAGPQTVLNWASAISSGPADEAKQTIAFSVNANSNPNLFLVAPAVSPAGTLTYTPAANVSGTAKVTLVATDTGGTANGGADTSAAVSFAITVTAVNDAPTFTRGANVTVLEDAPAQSIALWATAISPGPTDESGQTVDFIVSNTNNALFSAQPTVTPAGTLAFGLAPNANGDATVTVKLHDNGGVLNGGIDTSAAQTFTISVT